MKDFSNFHSYYMQLTFEQDGVRLAKVKDDDAEYTVRFYVQRETGHIYQWSHFYDMYILTYKNGLPANLHLNSWILPPVISVKFADMSHLAEKRVPQTFDYYFNENIDSINGIDVIINGKLCDLSWTLTDKGDVRNRLANARLANIIFDDLYIKSLIDSEELYNDIYGNLSNDPNKLIDILHNLKSNKSKFVGTKLEPIISDKIKETLQKLFEITKESLK